jgi:DNA-binding MarR family transcriptional regulator
MFNLEECLAHLTSSNAKQLAEILDRRLRTIGITRVQWMAAYYVDRNPDISQHDLALKMQVKGSTMARLLDRMAADNLILREASDRRTNKIILTPQGKEYCDKGTHIAEKFKNDAIMNIPPEYLDHFRYVLDKMVQNTVSTSNTAEL